MGKSNPLLEQVRKTLKDLQETSKKTEGLWKPTGEHTVRLVPYQHAEFPFIQLYFHYGIDSKNYLSPKSFGRPDPFERFADELLTTKDQTSYKLSKSLRAKLRVYVPVLVRGEESEGVRFWAFGKNTYEEILKIMSDPDYGDITDPTTGTDLVITFQTAEEAGNSFGKTTIRAKRNTSPMADSEKLTEKYLNEQKAITDIFKELEYDELKEILENWISNKPAEKATEKEESEPEEKEESKEVVKKAEAAFDELFNKKKTK
jgi:hypothetical protein